MRGHGAAFGALLLSGALGSLGHCLGMCGPLALMLGLRAWPGAGRKWPALLLFHGARLAVYTLLGGAAAGLGSLAGLAAGLSNLAGVLSLALGLAAILVGLGYLGWRPHRAGLASTGAQASKVSETSEACAPSGLWKLWQRAMGWGLQGRGTWGVTLLGALNGLLPCGLVYGALLVATSLGAPLSGAMGMLLFGLGTVPALVVAGLWAGALSLPARRALRPLPGYLMAAAGLQLLLRGLAALRLAPHLHIGSLMLW